MARALLVVALLALALGAQAKHMRAVPRLAASAEMIHPNAANFFAGKWDPTHGKKNYTEMEDQVKEEREAGHKIVGKIDKSKLGEINETRYNKEWHREYRPNNCDTYSAGPHVPGDIHNRPCYKNATQFNGAGSASASPLTLLTIILAVTAALRMAL